MARAGRLLLYPTALLLAGTTPASVPGSAGLAQGQRVAPTEEADVAEIKRLENERIAAGLRRDVDGFAAAAGDDYLQIEIDGNVSNKAATLSRMRASAAQLQSNPVDEMQVRVYGNTAVVTARARPTGVLAGKEFKRSLRYTRVYVKREGVWQIVLFQQTAIANATP
jgi:uncharacterized protein (TIGR02246 family)